ncbi:hypothetical protein BXU11_04910 [Flavobacterium sp. LM5]|uniref:EpsG family protein n=1 Tax=Flavobacterium sp. LM5 TaxID=1938610 RepID=UPI0009938954|nr:EpsG family protein [Flavobacterium sp. LM5]OOV29262.1 hypothetical protein BXU11_04910 [Flavobacterium sp. LM5]
MVTNLFVILLILIIGFHYSRKNDCNNYLNRKKYIWVICFILILQSGLRNVAVGADTYAYFNSFENSKNQSWDDVWEIVSEYYKYDIGKDPGFPVFEKFCSTISDSYQIFLVIIAILFFVSLGNFILKNTTKLQDVILAFVIYSVLFYGFFSITGHRQTLATALTLLSFEFIKKRKIIPFLIVILIASTLHKSSLIFILFYFVCRIKKPKIIFISTLLLFPLFMSTRDLLAAFFQSISGYEGYDQFEGAGTFTFSAIFLLICITALIRQKILLKSNSNTQNYFNAFALALLFLPLTWINPSMMRVVQYFSIFMLIFVPEIIRSFEFYSEDIHQRVRIVTLFVLILLFLKSSQNGEPYSFFWEEVKLGKHYE